MIFWLSVGVISVMVAIVLVLTVLRGRQGAPEGTAAREIGIYRDQLREVEKDLARGIITDAEAERLRTEVQRRLLEADRGVVRAEGRGASPRSMQLLAVAVVVGLVPLALWTYQSVGAQGFPDQPLAERLADARAIRENRPSQTEMEAQMAGGPVTAPTLEAPSGGAELEQLLAQLRSALENRPDDLQGHVLLAQNEASLGNFAAAARAQETVIQLLGDRVRADEHAVLAEYLILAAGGGVSLQAEGALERALRLDPNNALALYYSGIMFAQTGREDVTFQIWSRLHDISPGDAPWMPVIRDALPQLAQIAGQRYTLPPLPAPAGSGAAGQGAPRPNTPGPNADDIEAARDMAPEDQAAMIEGMVDRLATRLANTGGSAEEWARLIGALGVLGDTGRARAIWTEAQGIFATRDGELALIREAARSAGVAE
ncbi:c-type cytochrome biogenesis protein CcmI [Roseicitreum antarcticum]|uniref:Cytochrome c-type biogenesis protein CcmH n=1 Tax=Roseicitreum antarcticum TaxID=564137 RepID=A0A1H2ZUL1_9RHOB|nr:c-type cytochrome biogenesis protein CcmI [Roseicitreum antarcticum]SDX20594.1 cytochrome c-type biogenesis protein CcmH [Roseicitreum antarcticum]